MISYPGFTLEDYYSRPAIKIPTCQSRIVRHAGNIDFRYNKLGYRTVDFDNIPLEYFLVTGCSLTEGHGLEYHETWPYFLSNILTLPCVNLAKGGANAKFCNQVISRWIPKDSNPQFVIVQWPNMYRYLAWQNAQGVFVLNSNADSIYAEYVKNSDNYFFESWTSSIIQANEYCNHFGVPILNICLEEVDAIPKSIRKILSDHAIQLHLDEKCEGRTWFFDNKAKDGMHHSSWCTEKWAQRIVDLINPLLSTLDSPTP